MSDLPYNEDGDSNIDYSRQNDFYSGAVQFSAPANLEFQAFDPEETTNVPAPTFNPELVIEEPDPDVPPPQPSGNEKFWQLGYYQNFANVNTRDVGLRLLNSLFPYKNFFHVIGTNPDLYGWFWVASTLIFVLAATGNLSTYIGYYFDGDLGEWKYNFAKLGVGAAVIYFYVSVVPGLVYLATKFWLELEPTIVTHYCIFGYSLTPYIPIAFLMIIPFKGVVQFSIIMATCVLSTSILLRAYIPLLRLRWKEGIAIVAGIIFVNACFALFVYFYFYEFIESGECTTDTPAFCPSSTPSPSVTPSFSPTPSPSFVSFSPSPSGTGTSSPTSSFSPSPSPLPLSPTPSSSISQATAQALA